MVAHLPTGAGKTRVAAHVASRLLNAGALDDNGLVIWLASTAELCEQAAGELSRAWSHLGRWNAPVYRYWGDSDADLSAVSGGFLVAGLSKLWGLARRDRQQLVKLSSIAAGVVFDEAHQAVAATYEIMVGALLWDSPPLLGLAATPGRTSDPSPEDLKLTDLFAGNKVTIDPRGHANPIAFLVSGGYLAAVRFHQFEFDASISVVEDDADGDYGRDVLDAIGSDDRRTSDVVSLVRQCLRRHRRVMVFSLRTFWDRSSLGLRLQPGPPALRVSRNRLMSCAPWDSTSNRPSLPLGSALAVLRTMRKSRKLRIC